MSDGRADEYYELNEKLLAENNRLQATIEELKAEIAEWESGALVRGWREQWADRQAAKEKES